MPTLTKEAAQFWVAITATLGLVLTTAICLLVQAPDHLTSMLVGGEISIGSAAFTWLYRSGNGRPDRPGQDAEREPTPSP